MIISRIMQTQYQLFLDINLDQDDFQQNYLFGYVLYEY